MTTQATTTDRRTSRKGEGVRPPRRECELTKTLDSAAWAWTTDDDTSFTGFAAFATCVREEGQ